MSPVHVVIHVSIPIDTDVFKFGSHPLSSTKIGMILGAPEG
jgi:hypothetical protein